MPVRAFGAGFGTGTACGAAVCADAGLVKNCGPTADAIVIAKANAATDIGVAMTARARPLDWQNGWLLWSSFNDPSCQECLSIFRPG